MIELLPPTTDLHAAWLAARDDWGRGVHQAGSGLGAKDDVDTAAGFAAFVARLRGEEDHGVPPAEGRVHATTRWIVEDGAVLGAISLRHELNDFLLRAGGHIGYGIRPAARRRGLATWAMVRTLERARGLGLARVLVTCEDTNLASRRVIEGAGGVLEDIRETELGLTRRYWIELAPRPLR